jgi:hypothetical protein
MKQNIFTIYDVKAEAYLQPIFVENEATAKRALMDVLGNPEHQFAKYPMDYSLFHIGKYSQENGSIEPLPPTFVCNLHELLKVQEEFIQAVPTGAEATN